jgi:hypothetical protein
MDPKFIVAEVSKNWQAGDTAEQELLSQRFEAVINTNLARGYLLVDWKTSVYVHDEIVNESIFAVFEKMSSE